MLRKFKIVICIPLAAYSLLGFVSCSHSKSIPGVVQKKDTSPAANIPGEASLSPGSFRARAQVLDQTLDTVTGKINYRMLLREITERGQSLIYPVAAGDTVSAEPWSAQIPKDQSLQNTEVIALIEERMVLNSDRPLYLLKSIRKK